MVIQVKLCFGVIVTIKAVPKIYLDANFGWNLAVFHSQKELDVILAVFEFHEPLNVPQG